jgi:hypothetical protein
VEFLLLYGFITEVNDLLNDNFISFIFIFIV